MDEWFYADDLGDVYDGDVHKLIIDGQREEAKTLLAQVEGFVSHYKSLDKFDWMRHEGFLILARAMIAGNEQRLDEAIQHFGQLLTPSYREHFASQPSISFVIGQASRNVGQIYHMAYGRSDEAIPFIEESLKYYQSDSDELVSAQTLLDRVRRKRGVIQAITAGWGRIAWGTSLADFQKAFPQASQDEDWWISEEGPCDIAGYALNEVKYAFNRAGQLYLIALFPNEPSKVMADLPYVFGASDKLGTAGWTYENVEVSLKADGHVVLLTNGTFDDTAPTPQPVQTPVPVRSVPPPIPLGANQPITDAGAGLVALKLRLLANTAQGAFLQLYCPMRKWREVGAEGTWLLLALLPPAGMFLVGLLLTLVARGMGISVIVVGVLYAICAAYVSFVGPTVQKAEATLAAVGPRRQELRGLIQQQEKVQQQQKLLRPSRRAPPLPHRTPAERVPPPSVKWSDTECRRCKYLAPRKKCARCDSPFFTRSVEPTHSCPGFELNPARDYYSQATVQMIKEDASEETVTQLLETAIQGGLPEDEDVLARTFLANRYADLAFSRHPDDFNAGLRDPLLSEALKQLEHAVRVDVEQRYGVFSPGPNRAMLSRFDACYRALVSEVLEKTLSRDALLAYLKERDAFFGRVPGDPMLYLLTALGLAYYNRGERQTAKAYFQRLVNSESEHDQETIVDMKDRAREVLAAIG